MQPELINQFFCNFTHLLSRHLVLGFSKCEKNKRTFLKAQVSESELGRGICISDNMEIEISIIIQILSVKCHVLQFQFSHYLQIIFKALNVTYFFLYMVV